MAHDQASAIPYRIWSNRVEICFITSNGRGDWIFPKGNIEPGDTPVETAEKETWEEAGLLGEVDPDPITTYTYYKWGTHLEVAVFLLEVTSEETDWPEDDLRDRRWAPLHRADGLLQRPTLREILNIAAEAIG